MTYFVILHKPSQQFINRHASSYWQPQRAPARSAPDLFHSQMAAESFLRVLVRPLRGKTVIPLEEFEIIPCDLRLREAL